MNPLSPRTPVPARRRALTAAALAGVLTLAACASTPATPEDQLRQRAQARWNALVANDFAKAYTYAPPSFRAVTNPQDYRTRFGPAASWKSAWVHDVTCEAERCTVSVRVTLNVRAPQFATKLPNIETYTQETWVREDGQWWHVERI